MPDSNRRLCDFAPGDPFDGAIFIAALLAVRATSGGAPFLSCKLRDSTGEVAAKLWNAPDDILAQLSGSKLVKVRGFVERGGKYSGDFRLQSIAPHPSPDDLTPFLTPLTGDFAAHKARFFEMIRAVKNPHLHALLKEIFRTDGEYFARFCEAPAAKSMHHSHRGGLLEHSGEVALLCDKNASVLPHLDRDLLVTAALLHDIGKLEEMESGLSAGTYTHAGELVGHVVLGTCIVASAANEIEGFPPKLKAEVMHLILSHHGEPEFGAARRPMCAEALILSLCDLMSAKVAQCRDKTDCDGDFAPLNQGWHGLPDAPQRSIYIGKMREMRDNETQ